MNYVYQQIVRVLFGFATSEACRPYRIGTALEATLYSRWSAM